MPASTHTHTHTPHTHTHTHCAGCSLDEYCGAIVAAGRRVPAACAMMIVDHITAFVAACESERILHG
jgi:hypothetical protein